MTIFQCELCPDTFEADETPRRGSICFKCHIQTVSLRFTYGKDDFHGPTIRERIAETEADALANGITAEPVSQGWF